MLSEEFLVQLNNQMLAEYIDSNIDVFDDVYIKKLARLMNDMAPKTTWGLTFWFLVGA